MGFFYGLCYLVFMNHSSVDRLYEGRFVNLVKRGTWEFATRNNVTGIVGIVAITDDQKLILVEQFRPPVDSNVIELPAGLAGDHDDPSEPLVKAAKRELLEETGYEAELWQELFTGAPSAGICDEILTFFYASGLKKVQEGGGDEHELITIHEIHLNKLHVWLRQQEDAGKIIDIKIYSGLFGAKFLLDS